MKRLLLIPITFITFFTAQAQIANDFMIGGGVDLAKTDNDGFFEKAQFGTELNYFLSRTFTATGGFEVWTGNDVSFVVGTRWFPNDDFFVRARGLVGENDLSLGAGWNKPLNEKIRFEAMGDFYFKADFSIRVGIQYIFRRK